MKTPILREWNVEAPWGIISLTSWGNKDAAPVFLVHGRQDCTDTFQPLLDLMPWDEYHYVGIDLPGSGMSTHMPVGVKIMRFHYLGAIEVALKHLGWDKFIFMGHSMGCELGLFYSAIYPGKITKMILLDAEPTLRRLQVQDLAEYQATFYDNYYNNYAQENYHYKTYTKAQAIEALMKARNLTEDKASIIINKSLVHLRDDLYRFTWGHRLKFPAPQNYPNTYYFALFRNIPPCLLISALGSLNENTKYSPGSRELISMMETLKNFKHVVVEGDHDVHLSHPEKVAPYVNEFLRKNNILSSKL